MPSNDRHEPLTMARILITGASGFIGRHLVSSLADRHRIVALVRSDIDFPENVDVVVADLSDPLAALPHRIDAVIHLAQSRRYREFPDGAPDVFSINVESTFNLLEYARRAGARSFVLTSTGGVYGYSYERFAESDPVSPLNFYFSSKYSAELLLASYRRFFSTVVLRPFFVYGPGQQRMLISSLIDRIIAGDQITIDGSPGLRINPIYVDDAVRVFEPALTHEGSGLFNVAGDEAITITDLVYLISELTGAPANVAHTQGDFAGDLLGDNSQMREVLGVKPAISLREGISRTIAARVATA
jgi:UDP-glucose 4-epimerase